MKVHKEGYKTIFITLTLAIIFSIIALDIFDYTMWAWVAVALFIGFTIFILSFFRVPVRVANGSGTLVSAPADGKVVIVEDLISTGMSSLAAKNALVNAGADILGMVAIFSYNFNHARKAFEDANVELTTLSNYDTLIEVAAETGYVKDSEIEVLKQWRFSPSTWGKKE